MLYLVQEARDKYMMTDSLTYSFLSCKGCFRFLLLFFLSFFETSPSHSSGKSSQGTIGEQGRDFPNPQNHSNSKTERSELPISIELGHKPKRSQGISSSFKLAFCTLHP